MPTMKKAVIVGARGQDGRYLSDHLKQKDYTVIGLGKNDIDITQGASVAEHIKAELPDEVYYLAAVHQSSQDTRGNDAALFKASLAVNVEGLFHFLDAIDKLSPTTRLFYAASSHIFGHPDRPVQDETTPIRPDCIYGMTKAAGLNACRFYRENRNVFASVGILYNHESPLRAPQFISRKVVQTLIAIKQGREKELVVGDLKTAIDWGYAGDYVEAMTRILELPAADDFIIASGTTHTIEEFIDGTARLLGLDWQNCVREDPTLISKKPKGPLQGDHSKLTKATGWQPTVDLNGIIKIMVEEELKEHVPQ